MLGVLVPIVVGGVLLGRMLAPHLAPRRVVTVGPERMAHLFQVGPGKPLGYLSFWTLYENGHDPVRLARRFRDRGLRSKMVRPSEDRLAGALYVYDPQALQSLLDDNAHVLRRARWPEDADGFVENVMGGFVRERDDGRLYRLIGLAFNDPRFRVWE